MSTFFDPSPDEPRDAEPPMQIMTALALLPRDALITIHQLAQLFGRHVTSVKRAIQRGELPPPVALLNEQVWMVAVILDHIRARLEAERTAVTQITRHLQQLRPGQGGLS